MKYTSFTKVFKRSALVGTGLGLLLPVLPASAATFNLNSVSPLENSQAAESQELLIAQGGCPRAMEILVVETTNFIGSICEDSQGDVFYHGYDKYYGTSINVYDVEFVEAGPGYYNAYNEGYTYSVGEEFLQVTDPSGEIIVDEYSIY